MVQLPRSHAPSGRRVGPPGNGKGWRRGWPSETARYRGIPECNSGTREEAVALNRLQEEFQLTHQQVADAVAERHRHGREQDSQGLHRQVPDPARPARALRAGLGLPRATHRVQGDPGEAERTEGRRPNAEGRGTGPELRGRARAGGAHPASPRAGPPGPVLLVNSANNLRVGHGLYTRAWN